MGRRIALLVVWFGMSLVLAGCTLPFGFSLTDVIPGMGQEATETLPPPPTRTATEPAATPFQTLTSTPADVIPTVTAEGGKESPPEETPTPEDVSPTPTEETGLEEELTPTSTGTAADTTATLIGKVLFPASRQETPPFRVVAFDQASDEYYYTVTRKGGPEFELDGLPPGEYVIVAYIIPAPGNPQPNWSAGYSEAVLCGLGDDCTDHDLLVVSLQAGEVREDINPGDWYAEPGTYPEDPTREEE